LTVASRRHRVAAGLIDAAVFGPPIVAVSIGAGWLYVWYRRGNGRDLGQGGPVPLSTRWNLVIWGASAAVRVSIRNWRSPGDRALGLRRVDVRTGGPLSVRNALVEQSVVIASGQLRRRLMKPWLTRSQRRLEALLPEMKQIQREFADDREAREQALKAFYKRNHVNPAASCAPSLLGAILMYAPGLWSPLNQTLPERLGGIVVVQD
jgi:60Kd inner membrane protein/RDD family